MDLSSEDRAALGVALEEATLLGVEVDRGTRRAAITFAVLSLPMHGPQPEDRRVQFVFESIGRVAASLRLGHWDDDKAAVQPFLLEELLPTVQSFGGLPIYGWEFFDVADRTFPPLAHRLSLDVLLGFDGEAHSLFLFQGAPDRHLDLWFWFERFTIRDPVGRVIPLADFTAGGRRWWDAFHQHDPRTQGHGIFPLS